MTIQAPFKPSLLRADSCSSAEIKKSLLPKDNVEPMPVIKQQRRINFNNQVIVRTIQHVNDIDEEEIVNIWYQSADYRQMRDSFAITVRKISNGKYKGDDEHHCARGLEFRSNAGAQRRKVNKLDALIAVLDEQERQIAEDDENPEALACVYIHSNHARRHEAQQRGELDAEEASRVYSRRESLTSLLYNSSIGESEQKQEKGNVGKRIVGRIFKRKERSSSITASPTNQ
jgi:hypothetical protein